jgi:lipoprotein-anchoring transpeptidase ErfK/SrfK
MYTQARPVRQPKPKTKKRPIPWLLMGGLMTMGFTVFVVMLLGLWYFMSYNSNEIPSGVNVAGIQVGGLSASEASSDLQTFYGSRMITVTDGDRSWPVSLSALGVVVDVETAVEDAQDAAPNTTIEPYYAVDLNQTQNELVQLSSQANIAAMPGNPPQMGRAIDIPVVLDRLRVDAAGELADGTLELTMITVEPPVDETVNQYNGVTTTHVVEQGQELGLIAREYGVSVEDILAMNDLDNPDLLYIGQELVIPAAGIYTPTAADAPSAPTSTGKAIVVSTEDQRIYAYENGQLVRSDLVSTGLPATPTVQGDYHIYVKYTATDMSGPGYYLPQVPYTMYFYEGYGIHGTYWHNSFGRPMSHGCVNLPTSEAEWFFNWADVGTLVRVI